MTDYLDLYEMPESVNTMTDDDYWNEGEFIIPLFDPTFTAPNIPKKSNGETCIRCKEFNKYAEPNQANGTFKCFSCRNYG